MPDLLRLPEVQIVAVCDPVKESHDYVDWSKDGLRASIAEALGKPDWRRGAPGIPGGRDVAQGSRRDLLCQPEALGEVQRLRHLCRFSRAAGEGKGRERRQDHDARPSARDDCHRGDEEGQACHDAQADRQPLQEARLVIETARKTKVATHFLPASDGANIRQIKGWIDDGAIGTLREIHNWSNRPVWPQYATIPTDTPPVPAGFDWQLWLGPSLDRPYHPHYTHAVFRGWYEFGGGALADMGHYSLWPVFRLFELDAPVVVESRPSHLCTLTDNVA